MNPSPFINKMATAGNKIVFKAIESSSLNL